MLKLWIIKLAKYYDKCVGKYWYDRVFFRKSMCQMSLYKNKIVIFLTNLKGYRLVTLSFECYIIWDFPFSWRDTLCSYFLHDKKANQPTANLRYHLSFHHLFNDSVFRPFSKKLCHYVQNSICNFSVVMFYQVALYWCI